MSLLLLLLLLLPAVCTGQFNPNMVCGRTSMVHLFEWRWEDIAEECERFLGPHGFGGVQISPPNENLIVSNPNRPWWERYQPVSYEICTRSGNELEFRDMVTRCNNAGVHIYADTVINHMSSQVAGKGNSSTCGSPYDTDAKSFPAVPYSYHDFNDGKCNTDSGDIEDYTATDQVRDCRLEGLLDLALQKEYVRGKILEYMNKLIDIGVAGFRIDASKHMWPGDIQAIAIRLNNLNNQWFPKGSRPSIFQEVIDLGGEGISVDDYFNLGRVTEFKYGAKLGTVFRKWESQNMASLKTWGEDWDFMPNERAIVFVDNHDNQRGQGAGGDSILTFFDARLYKMAVCFMLAHPYGFPRLMSSYWWPRNIVDGQDINDWMGPPSHSDGSTKAVTINEDSTCGNGWVCEHRWRQIKNMVIFRNVAYGQALTNWWDNGENQIAFGCGQKGFIVFNNEDWDMDVTLYTGLPPGTYCDVISGEKIGNHCTGIQVTVGKTGSAHFTISSSSEDPFVAIHMNSKL